MFNVVVFETFNIGRLHYVIWYLCEQALIDKNYKHLFWKFWWKCRD